LITQKILQTGYLAWGLIEIELEVVCGLRSDFGVEGGRQDRPLQTQYAFRQLLNAGEWK
jgi:hypothetical protein